MWDIHWMADFWIVVYLPGGKTVTRFDVGAGKPATARTFCAALNHLIDWGNTDPE
jgi:hypothetical protein